MLYGVEYPFGHSELAVLVVSAPSFLVTTSLLAGAGRGEVGKCWHCASTSQWYSKHWCVTNTVLVTDSKYRTIPCAMKKIKSILARPSTIRPWNYLLFSPLWHFSKWFHFIRPLQFFLQCTALICSTAMESLALYFWFRVFLRTNGSVISTTEPSSMDCAGFW